MEKDLYNPTQGQLNSDQSRIMPHEIHVINEFLNKSNVTEIELYEELRDHIVTSFQNREETDQTIDEHLTEIIKPSFGGKTGIRDMVQNKRELGNRLFRQQILSKFLFFITTAKGLLIMLPVVLLMVYLEATSIAWINLTTLLFIGPYSLSLIFKWYFKHICKKRKLPFRDSRVAKYAFLFPGILVGLGQGLPDILNRIINGSRFNTLNYLGQFQILQTPIITALTIYAILSLALLYDLYQKLYVSRG
jgi:hypothetical protein